MNKNDWKKAKKILADAENASSNITVDRLLKAQFQQKADRTLYFREYFRKRAASELPEDRKCPLCMRVFLERKQWRDFDGKLICAYCKGFMNKSLSHIRYYVDRNQLCNAIGANPFITRPAFARLLGITSQLLEDLLSGNRKFVLRSTYKKMKRGYPFKFGRKLEQHAPAFMKYLRESAGWTQARCAEYLGVENYRDIESGRISCPLGSLDQLIKELVRDSGLVQYLTSPKDV